MATVVPDYDIFENSEDYFQNEALVNFNSHTHNANFCYTTENTNFKTNLDLMNLCKDFIMFLEKLQDEYMNDTTKYSKYREYVNFWLTYKLTATGKPDDYITEFYEFIQNDYKAFPQDGELKSKIYHIKGKSFNNMSILYELYKLYYEIKDKSQEKCPNFHEKFMKNYNLAISKCYTDDEKLCNALEKFKSFYDENRSSRLSICSKQGLPILPKFVAPKPSIGMNFIDKLAYYIYQSSNKQTKDGLSITLNRKYPKLVQLLSLNYNMLLYDKEHEKKKFMIEILYEFIKFCKERNTITFLDSLKYRSSMGFYNKQKNSVPFINLFIKEFFENYYQHNEYEYGEIYKECSTNESSSTYCTVYNQCSQELGNDLFKIKDNIKTHIEYKATQSEELASKYSSGDIPMHKEGEDIVSSNTTPINIGVGVGALFTLSSLYKFTPIGSWLNRTFLGKGNNMNNYGEENDLEFFGHNSSFDNYIPENARFNVAYNAA
ncbi:PIR Superfamily Protein [Plasmodium ovale curtisi]|uniref:PIR Superfamily Protein n=1 Tax=Plasmodium ovale curtisi TaxID=864141 RepID=A0A1A8WNK3_PLAOA|nr:PIR Superfamily Protein [Plasmodium ovale curtisi]SBT00965.1 PIR Superfamily Protein [Plasmodium ovale curtisi]